MHLKICAARQKRCGGPIRCRRATSPLTFWRFSWLYRAQPTSCVARGASSAPRASKGGPPCASAPRSGAVGSPLENLPSWAMCPGKLGPALWSVEEDLSPRPKAGKPAASPAVRANSPPPCRAASRLSDILFVEPPVLQTPQLARAAASGGKHGRWFRSSLQRRRRLPIPVQPR